MCTAFLRVFKRLLQMEQECVCKCGVSSIQLFKLLWNAANIFLLSWMQPMLDVPIYGRIATLELFRPPVSH